MVRPLTVVVLFPCLASSFMLHSRHQPRTRPSLDASCTQLKNLQSYFTVPVGVGDVGTFDVVIDTGSDLTVIPACSCGKCTGKCYPDPQGSLADGATHANYASGSLTAIAVSDTVTVGADEANMQNSLLLMTDNDFSFNLEGVLGLGPGSASQSFLRGAGVSQFSICLSQTSSGSLTLGTALGDSSLRVVGQTHWGLGLTGVSVGSGSGSGICSSNSVDSGSVVPCGAVVDTGSTAINVPPDHLEIVYQQLCEGWSRCSDKDELQALVKDCKDVNSLPTLYFDLKGNSGQQKVEISPGSYVFHGKGGCQLAFYPRSHITQEFGPIWILGLPLFFEYTVGYDITQQSMSFVKGVCGACDGNFLEKRSNLTWEVNTPFRMTSVDPAQPL